MSDSWAYASATTITVPTDATLKYSAGDKIRVVQSGSTKYFYIVSLTSTVLTISGGTDYTLTNVAISSIYYSKAQTPLGFPQWFARTPAITANGGTFTSVAATGRFSMAGKKVTETMVITVTTLGSATGSTVATLAATASTANAFVGAGRGDVVTGAMYQCRLRSTTTVDIYKYDGTMGQANTEVTRVLLQYEAA